MLNWLKALLSQLKSRGRQKSTVQPTGIKIVLMEVLKTASRTLRAHTRREEALPGQSLLGYKRSIALKQGKLYCFVALTHWQILIFNCIPFCLSEIITLCY